MPVFSHCFDQEECLADQGSPLQASVLLFWGLSSSVSHFSGYQRGNTPATTRAGNMAGSRLWFHMAPNKNMSCVALCFWSIPITDCFYYLNIINKLKGSKCTLGQISLLHSVTAPSSDTEASKRNHETYFEKAFQWHFCHVSHDFPEQPECSAILWPLNWQIYINIHNMYKSDQIFLEV